LEAKTTIQKYECRLRRSGVLRVADIGGHVSACSSEAAASIGHALCKNVPHEQVWLILLDGKNAILGVVRLGEGGLHGCALRPADVFRPVLVAGASGCVLIHNHPSGDPTPSASDLEMTRSLASVGESLGVHVLDHVIVTRDAARWSSIRDAHFEAFS
jgi:DNA repair protein RadC